MQRREGQPVGRELRLRGRESEHPMERDRGCRRHFELPNPRDITSARRP